MRIEGLSDVGDRGPRGHLWAEPSVSHLRSLMRWAFENPTQARVIPAIDHGRLFCLLILLFVVGQRGSIRHVKAH